MNFLYTESKELIFLQFLASDFVSKSILCALRRYFEHEQRHWWRKLEALRTLTGKINFLDTVLGSWIGEFVVADNFHRGKGKSDEDIKCFDKFYEFVVSRIFRIQKELKNIKKTCWGLTPLALTVGSVRGSLFIFSQHFLCTVSCNHRSVFSFSSFEESIQSDQDLCLISSKSLIFLNYQVFSATLSEFICKTHKLLPKFPL